MITLGILLSTTVKAAVVAKLVILLGIMFLTSFILVLRAELVAKLVILGIWPLTSFVLVLTVLLVATLYPVFYLQCLW